LSTSQSRREPTRGPNPATVGIHLVSGPEFVVAPRHRFFAVFDEPDRAVLAVRQLVEKDITKAEIWVYVGEQGARTIEPAFTGHGPGVAVVRLAQRVLTNDCEYCEQLSKALHEHAMVVAVEIEPDALQDAREVLAEGGGHSFAYGEHWNFIAVPVES
jgi:hypothetical protein